MFVQVHTYILVCFNASNHYFVAKHIAIYKCCSYNLIVPVLIMSIIGVFSIFLEAGSNDKMNLVVMVLLGFMFFQDVIAKQLPKSDQTPYLSKYLLWALIMAGVNLAICAMVMWVHSIQVGCFVYRQDFLALTLDIWTSRDLIRIQKYNYTVQYTSVYQLLFTFARFYVCSDRNLRIPKQNTWSAAS